MTWVADLMPQLPGLIGAGGIAVVLKSSLDFLLRRRSHEDAVNLKLLENMSARIKVLEAAGDAERIACAQTIEHQRELYEAKLSQLRHEVANYRSENQMLLLVLEMEPERAAAILSRYRQRCEPQPLPLRAPVPAAPMPDDDAPIDALDAGVIALTALFNAIIVELDAVDAAPATMIIPAGEPT